MNYRKRFEKPTSKYFLTRSGYVYAFLMFSFDTIAFTGLVNATSKDTTVIHILIVEILFILPLNFLMTVIGHYTQSSCVAVGWMQPIIAGYSFCSISHTCLILLHDFLLIRDLGIYLVYSWTTGGEAYIDCRYFETVDIFCIDYVTTIDDLKEQASKQPYPLNTTNLSSHIFYKNVVAEKFKSTDDKELAYLRVATGMMHGTLTFLLPILLYYLAQVKLNKVFKVFKPLALMLITMVFLEILFMLFLPNSFDEMGSIYDEMIDGWRYLSYEVWLDTLARQVKVNYPLCIHWISLAALLDPKINTETVAVDSWFAHIFVAFINGLAYLLVKGALHGQHIKKISVDMTKTMEYLLVFFPAATNFMLTGYTLVLIAFYTILFITWTVKSSVLLQLVFNCFTDIFPFAVQYKKYIVPTYLIIVALTSFLLFSSEYLDKEINWLEKSQGLPIWVTLFLFAFFALWFYGVTNLCDDVHFKVGQQPSVFWKICLWPAPLFYFLMILRMSNKFSEYLEEIKTRSIYTILILVQIIYAVPFIIRLIYEIIRYILNRNLLKLVKPQDRWGDPDPEERIARRIYPPRLETKFRRRFDYCNHRCLRYNQVFRALDEKEYDTRAALLNIPQELIEEKHYIYSIIRRNRRF